MTEYEVGVLASVLSGAKDIDLSLLKPDDFPSEDAREIFLAMQALDNEKKNFSDPIFLVDKLQTSERGKIAATALIVNIVTSPFSGSNYEEYTVLLQEERIRKEIRTLCDRVVKSGKRPDDLLSYIDDQVSKIRGNGYSRDVHTISSVYENVYPSLEKPVMGLFSSYHELDDVSNGFFPGQMYVLAGRPSMGKSTLALSIATNVCTRDEGVMFFSLETSKEMLCLSAACAKAGVSLHVARKGQLDKKEFAKLTSAISSMSSYHFWVDDTPGIKLSEIRAKIKQLKRKNPVSLVIIDYLQLVESDKNENRVQEVSTISRGIKNMAREFNVPFLALSQLSRGVESRECKKPHMSDLRESGTIEQDADFIVMLYRDDYYNANSESPGTLDLIIAKNRFGPTKEIRLLFNKSLMKIENPVSM